MCSFHSVFLQKLSCSYKQIRNRTHLCAGIRLLEKQMHCCKKTIFARSQNIVNSPGVVCAYVCSSVMNCSMTHLFLSELIKLQRLLCSRINGCCVTTGMIGVGDTHYYMRVSLLACTVWRGYRAGWDNIGGQDVTQWTEIKDTPSSACFFFFTVMLKNVSLCTAFLQASSWM